MTRRAIIGALSSAMAAAPLSKLKVCAFSKHFQWTDWAGTAALVKELGFDGVDLTVREGGHVLPSRVTDDLPKAAEIIRAAGLELPMITAGIVDAQSRHAEAILRTAHSLRIQYYRWGGFRYDNSRGIAAQLDALRPRVKDLAALNAQYRICAMYHTHSGPGQVGGPIWDVWSLVKDLDPKVIGINFDIGHATVEGGYGDWITTARLAMPHLRGTAIKDFRWGQTEKGEWIPQWCALGRGMVNLKTYFQMLRAAHFDGPVQLHFEYPELGDAHSGKTKSTIPKSDFMRIMRRDLAVLRTAMSA